MKLGITNLPGNNIQEVAQKAQRMGVDGIGLFIKRLKGFGIDLYRERDRKELKQVLADNDLKFIELGIYNNIMHPDQEVRKKEIQLVKDILAYAPELGNPFVITGGGSLNPNGAWFSHRDNFTEESWQEFITILKGIVRVAEENNSCLSLEPGVTTLIGTIERLKRAIEQVGSDHLKIHCDPFNLITYQYYYKTDQYLNKFFDVLGDYLVSAHGKDLFLEDKVVIHISETFCCNGEVDWSTYLKRLDRLNKKDFYLIIEHTAEEFVPAAKENIEKLAEQMGIELN